MFIIRKVMNGEYDEYKGHKFVRLSDRKYYNK